MPRPGSTLASAAIPRGPGDPEPDLLDHLVVRRAMTVDAQRSAVAAGELVGRPDPARMAALIHPTAGRAPVGRGKVQGWTSRSNRGAASPRSTSTRSGWPAGWTRGGSVRAR